jgi:pimeloyl-ACP methyl ester carboxylesterase
MSEADRHHHGNSHRGTSVKQRISVAHGSLLLLLWMLLASPDILPSRLAPPIQVRSSFITVNGVRLHYLDWGGKGPAMLFLPGAGHSAHIFSDIAPEFTDSFRVLGLTRRGHGQSDKPATGYDTGTLVDDIRLFLDALGITQVILVGHSMAGDELTRFAGMYPERVIKLVYLDAAYDRSQMSESFVLSRLSEVFALVAPTEQDLASMKSYRNWLQRKRYGLWSDALEADMRATVITTPEGIRPAMPGSVGQAIAKSTEESHPDYTKVKAPALSFYAISSMSSFFWLTAEVDERIRQRARDFLAEYIIPGQRKEIDRFKREMVRGRVVEMPNTSHFCFIDKRDEVVREMRAFLSR